MPVRYRHTQRGTLMVVAMGAGTILLALAGDAHPTAPGHYLLWALAAGLVVLGWLFSSLTVEIDEDAVRWHFGPGLWKYQIALADIDGSEIVRNTWWNGFGIRMRPGFRLYNVSGLDAVELRLKSGDVRRIGTDDPRGQRAAIKR